MTTIIETLSITTLAKMTVLFSGLTDRGIAFSVLCEPEDDYVQIAIASNLTPQDIDEICQNSTVFNQMQKLRSMEEIFNSPSNN